MKNFHYKDPERIIMQHESTPCDGILEAREFAKKFSSQDVQKTRKDIKVIARGVIKRNKPRP